MKDSIGVFDSCIGGLTVLKEIRKRLPTENLIYLGDTARVPYGTKSPETVIRYTLRNTEFLVSKGVKAIVIACNTASAYGLSEVSKHFDIPILGVITPGALSAVKATKNNQVGVIGTEGTIASLAYQKEIQKLNSHITTHTQSCPLLVGLAEEGRIEGEIVELVIKTYLEPLKPQTIDTLILGCTHYPLFKKMFQKILGNQVTLIDSAVEVASNLEELLVKRGLKGRGSEKGEVGFYSTDAPNRMEKIGPQFFCESMTKVHQIEITF